MNTSSNQWVSLMVRGAIAGMIAGAIMAMYAMIASVTFLGQGFFTPLYGIASPLVGSQPLMMAMKQGAFYIDPGPAVLGLVIHMMWSALYGVIFALVARGLHLKGIGAIVVGLLYGMVILLAMGFLVLPLVGAGQMPTMVGWPSFTIQHAMFGLALGCWPLINAQLFSGRFKQQVA